MLPEWEPAYTFSFSPDILLASNLHSFLHNHHLSGYTLRFPEFPYTISAGTSTADVPETLPAVSYTHLDVYKRQGMTCLLGACEYFDCKYIPQLSPITFSGVSLLYSNS